MHAEQFVIETWQQAEQLAVAHMVSLGFDDAAPTGPGRDGGIDVVARGAVAQVKHYVSAPIGAPAVQQLVGAARGKPNRVFYSYSGYTPAAFALAEDANVCLFQYTIRGEVTPASTAARVLADRGWANYDMPRTAAQAEFTGAVQMWGQRVLDTAQDIELGVLNALNAYMEGASADLYPVDQDVLDSYISLMNQDLRILRSLIEEMAGERSRVIADLVNQISRIEGMAASIAKKSGQSYELAEQRHM